MTRQKLIDLGLLTPASSFRSLPKDDLRRDEYEMRLILSGIEPRPWTPPKPLEPKENN